MIASPRRSAPVTPGSCSSRSSGASGSVARIVREPTIALISVVGPSATSACHEDSPIGVGVRLLEVVRREQDRLAVAGEVADRRPEGVPALDVHADGRLVEHEQLWIAHQRDRESQPLGLAAAEALRAPVGDRLDPRERERFVDVQRLREERGDHRDELTHGQLAQDTARLEHDSDPALLDRLLGRRSEHRDRSGVGRLKAEQHVDRRRLAGTVWPEQRDGLACAHGDVHASHRANRPCGRPVGLLEAAQLETRRRLTRDPLIHPRGHSRQGSRPRPLRAPVNRHGEAATIRRPRRRSSAGRALHS